MFKYNKLRYKKIKTYSERKKKTEIMGGREKLRYIEIRDDNPSNFLVGFGFLQKSVKKPGIFSDCGFLEF